MTVGTRRYGTESCDESFLFARRTEHSMIQCRENADHDADAYLEPRAVRAELACARTLLDELVTVLESHHDERTRCDVVAQVAEQLDRVADSMRLWATGRDHRHVPESGIVLSPSGERPSTSSMNPGRRER